jgi:hypothetical protein
MTHDFTRQPHGPCAKCDVRDATTWWMCCTLAALHGASEPRCERCCVVEQLTVARRLAAAIPELERRMAEMGGEND